MSASPKRNPLLLHPLCGADPATLWDVATGSGRVSGRAWASLAIAALSGIARLPFGLVETAMARRALRRRRGIPDPVFIVGHWRSGTTHLCNLMSRDPAFAYVSPIEVGLPWELLSLARWLEVPLRRALPESRYIDEVAVNPDSPQEDEIALASMSPLSYYHGIYFPRRFAERVARGVFLDDCEPGEIARWKDRLLLFHGKIALRRPNRTPLVKNPVYTARIALLREIWPDARFIHIHRNPFIVFESTCRFYYRLFEELSLQDVHDVPVRDVVLETYPRMMDRLLADTADLPSDRFAEIRFEDLEAAPLATLEQVYQQLGLPGFDAARGRIESYLGTLTTYTKNSYRFSEPSLSEVERRWAPYLELWGYARPRQAA